MKRTRDAIVELDKRYVWHPFTAMGRYRASTDPIVAVRAEGARIFDADGRSYLDANSSWWCALLGHGHPRIVEHELYALGETGFASTGEPVDRIDRDKGDSTLRRLQPMQQEVHEAKVRIVAQRDFEAVGGSGTFTAADVLARHEV